MARGADSPSALADLIAELPEELREQALTHATWTEHRTDSYERLAYLGDSVLGLAVASDLFDRFPTVDAGGLTKIHNQAVSGVSCAEVGRAARRAGDAAAPSPGGPAIPAEVLLDGVPAAARGDRGPDRRLLPGLRLRAHRCRRGGRFRGADRARRRNPVDFKSALQELLAQRGARVSYEVIARIGTPTQTKFEVAAIVDSEQVGKGGEEQEGG